MTLIFWYYITMIKIIKKHGLFDRDFIGGLTPFIFAFVVSIMS